MRLTDSVEVFVQGVGGWDAHGNDIPGELVSQGIFPANVSFQMVERSYDGGATARMIEQLRAILPPMEYDPATMQIKWDGNLYTNDGPPMQRRRNGRTHHLTIPLKLVSG